jgi:hypothetical protein
MFILGIISGGFACGLTLLGAFLGTAAWSERRTRTREDL